MSTAVAPAMADDAVAGQSGHGAGQERASPTAPSSPTSGADEDHAHAGAEDEARDLPDLCAEGHPDADLVRPLRDDPGDDPVDAERGQEQTEERRTRPGGD